MQTSRSLTATRDKTRQSHSPDGRCRHILEPAARPDVLWSAAWRRVSGIVRAAGLRNAVNACDPRQTSSVDVIKSAEIAQMGDNARSPDQEVQVSHSAAERVRNQGWVRFAVPNGVLNLWNQKRETKRVRRPKLEGAGRTFEIGAASGTIESSRSESLSTQHLAGMADTTPPFAHAKTPR